MMFRNMLKNHHFESIVLNDEGNDMLLLVLRNCLLIIISDYSNLTQSPSVYL